MIHNIKKGFNRTGVYLSEKFGSKKSVDAGEEYEHLCQLTDQCKKLYEEMKKRSVEIVKPSGNSLRLIPTIEPSIDWSNCAEEKLAECFTSYVNALKNERPFSQALHDAAEAFRRLAAERYQAAEELKTSIVTPLRSTLNEDIKDIAGYRKETEKLRLALEYKHKKVEKGINSETNPDYMDAKQRYEESLSMTESAMVNFHEGEAEQLMLLSRLVDPLLTYYKDAADVLLELQKSIRRNSESLKNMPKLRPNVASSASSPTNSLTGISKNSASAKPTPMCRALYDFEAKTTTELNFHEGDTLLLLDQVDENWFLGSLDGVKGHFPTTYVEVLVPLP